MPDKDTTLNLLRQSAADLRREVGRTAPEAALWRPAEGEWSVHECLMHLRTAETHVFLPRIRRTAAEDRPALPLFDETAYQQEHWDPDEPLADILAGYQAARNEIIAVLEAAPDWSRQGLHAARGPISLAWQADYALGHTWEHISQLMRVRLSHELSA